MKAKTSRGAGFGGLCAYVLDESKNAEIVAGNMLSDNAADLAQEFGSIRALRRDIAKPVWHCSLSLPPPERLDSAKWDEVIRAHLQNLGIDTENNQFVAVRHTDADHDHVHVVVNRIGADGKIWGYQNDVFKAIQSTQKLERDFGLTITPGLESPGAKPMSRAERAKAERTGELPARLKIQQAIDSAPNNSLEAFVNHLAAQGVNVRPSGASGAPRGISFECDGVAFKGSALGKRYAWKAISARLHVTPEDQEIIDELRSSEYQSTSESRVTELSNAGQAEALLQEAFSKNSTIAGDALEDLLIDSSPDVAALVQSSLTRAGIDSRGNPVFTSTAILTLESQMVSDAKALASNSTHDLTDAEIESAIQRKEREASAKIGRPVMMTDEQKEAVRHGLKGGLSIVQGSAGAGKSFSNEAIKIAYEGRGYKVLGAAVSKKAATVLESETGIKSATVAKLIKDLDDQKIVLNDKTCLVLDEAGLLSSSQWASLTAHARAAGAKIVASGEDKQLDSVQHGGALRYLSRDDVVGCARIEKIVRQNDKRDRENVMNLRDGKVSEALRDAASRGLINFVDDDPKAALIQAWRDYQQSHPDKNSLIVCHKNADARALGASIRAIRREEGIVIGQDFEFKASHGENKFDLTIATGDRVRLNKNDSQADLTNGDTGQILSIRPTDDGTDHEIVVSLDRGGSRTFLASEYVDEDKRLQMSLGYASTVYSAQGVTVSGDVFVLQTSGMDRANTYVSCSRAKDQTHLYCDRHEIKDLTALIKTASRDSVKELALEAAERLPEPNPELLAKVLDHFEKGHKNEIISDAAKVPAPAAGIPETGSTGIRTGGDAGIHPEAGSGRGEAAERPPETPQRVGIEAGSRQPQHPVAGVGTRPVPVRHHPHRHPPAPQVSRWERLEAEAMGNPEKWSRLVDIRSYKTPNPPLIRPTPAQIYLKSANQIVVAGAAANFADLDKEVAAKMKAAGVAPDSIRQTLSDRSPGAAGLAGQALVRYQEAAMEIERKRQEEQEMEMEQEMEYQLPTL